MPLPIGAGNSVNSIPFALQNDAARTSARDKRYSSAKTLTSDQMNPYQLANFMAMDDWCISGSSAAIRSLPHAEHCDLSPLTHALKNALGKGNPEGKTLQDLTLILKSTFRADTAHECRTVMISTERGQVTLDHSRWGIWKTGGITAHFRAAHNHQEIKKQKYAKFTDALTLSVLQTLFKPSLVDNFLWRRGVVMSNSP